MRSALARTTATRSLCAQVRVEGLGIISVSARMAISTLHNAKHMQRHHRKKKLKNRSHPLHSRSDRITSLVKLKSATPV